MDKMFLLVILMWSNFSYSQVEKMPWRLTDRQGNEIGQYCIVPVYAKLTGTVLAFVDVRGRKHDKSLYLMWATEYKDGVSRESAIKRKAPWSIPPFVFGEEIHPLRFVFLKKGYAPYSWYGNTSSGKIVNIVLDSGSPNEAVNLLLADFPDHSRLRDLYNFSGNQQFVNSYSEEERRLLRRCYDE